MLRKNLEALRIASALMIETDDRPSFTEAQLNDALGQFASMIDRTLKAQAKFPPGTSQQSLQRNRLEALRLGEARTKSALMTDKRPNQAME